MSDWEEDDPPVNDYYSSSHLDDNSTPIQSYNFTNYGQSRQSGSSGRSWRDRRNDSDRSGNYKQSWRGGDEDRGWQRRRSSKEEYTGPMGRSGSDSNMETVHVPSDQVKRIIGKGGQNIREIERKSGARVQVVRNSTSFEVPVNITGSDDAIRTAKDLIDETTAAVTSPPSHFGSSRSSSYSKSPSQFQQKSSDNYVRPPKYGPIDWKALKETRLEDMKIKFGGLPPVIKDFYTEHPSVAKRTVPEVEEFRLLNNNITVVDQSDKNRPGCNPICLFEEAFEPYPELLQEITKQGFERPTPIQCQVWPLALQGHDVIGIAQTGTGKTLAFLLPGMMHIEGQTIPRAERAGPTMLVLSPTRELALQIEEEVKKYSYKGIKCVCVYGGGDRKAQIDMVVRGVEIIIATPGRLNDLVSNGYLDVRTVSFLVLDEADRMLDMGFEPQIKSILLDVRPDRQTMMTSATWPPGVRRLAESYMTDPFQVSVGTLDLKACHLVTQVVEMVKEEEKKSLLFEFLSRLRDDEKALVFASRKIKADDISSDLILSGYSVQSIHGDRDQADREQALLDFKEGRVNILIATDVASRGLDIKDISYVVNYDFPRNIEDYVHRVGRTGRAGRSGRSLTFFTRDDWKYANELIAILEEAGQEVPDELVSMAERYQVFAERIREQNKEAGSFGHKRGPRRY